ncbi:MAG: TolC family protein, partial [Hymenobacter sp.]
MKSGFFLLDLLNYPFGISCKKVVFSVFCSSLRWLAKAKQFVGLLAGLWLTGVPAARAQSALAPIDTVRLTLPDAEQRFVQNNLDILAQRYNISVQQALAVQARLIDNPTISVDQNALQQTVHKQDAVGTNLDAGRTQVAVQVQQLFSLAGRRRAAGRAQEQAAVVESFNLEDLVRNLRYQLRTTFYDIYYRQQTLRVYDTEIPQLRHTVGLYQGQYEKGNIALKEVIRLKAFLFTLETERVGLITDQANSQADLHILLRDSVSTVYKPVVDARRLRDLSPTAYAETQLTDTALVRRADLLARRAEVQRQNLNLRLQRAVATPDLAIG